MDIIESLKELLGRDELPVIPPEQRRSNAKNAIEAWLRSQTTTQYGLAPDKFAERLRALVDHPQTLRQGGYNWCLPATFLHSVLRRVPDLVAQFGMDLYSKGEGRLRNIKVTMTEAYQAFDYPEAGVRTNPRVAEFNWDLFLASHADWILIGAIQDETTIYPMSGSPRDPISWSASTLVDLFEDCGLYEEVTTLSSADKRDRQKLVAALDTSRTTHDVLLVGGLDRFGVSGIGDHAARLVAPPVITPNGNSSGTAADKETMTFQYWSWGFQGSDLAGVPFDAAENAYTSTQTRRQFESFTIIVAKPKPL